MTKPDPKAGWPDDTVPWPEYPNPDVLSDDRKADILEARDNPYAVVRIKRQKRGEDQYLVIRRTSVTKHPGQAAIANWELAYGAKPTAYELAIRQAEKANRVWRHTIIMGKLQEVINTTGCVVYQTYHIHRDDDDSYYVVSTEGNIHVESLQKALELVDS